MRPSEIRKFSNLLKNVHLDVDAVQEFGEGKEWSDIPFPNLKSVEYYGFDLWSGHRKPDRVEKYHSFGVEGEYLIFEQTPDNAPSCMELLILTDELVGRSGDTHHRYFEGFQIEDDRLRICLGS
jgi:hypothetical protein